MSISRLIQVLKSPYHLTRGIIAYLWFRMFLSKLYIIGVTGTDGKTTTSTYIYHILKSADKRVALISTVSAYVGENEIDTGFHVTTPNPFQLFSLIRSIEKKGYEYLVLEVTSHGVDQHRVFGIRPEIAVLTNITHEHLDYHQTYDRYLKTKASFVARAKRVALINKADKSYKDVRVFLKKRDVTTQVYDLATANPFLKSNIRKVIPETYNQQNAVAAAYTTMALHVSVDTIIEALSTLPQIPGRREVIQSKPFQVIVDFAHTPNAIESSLLSERKNLQADHRLIAVYGAAGERDFTKRPRMGEIGARLADHVVFTAEDPRSERVEEIIKQMKDGVRENHGHVYEIVDRKKAIEFAIEKLAKPGDRVMIYGKGHEQSMNLNGKSETPWSDQEVVRKIVNQHIKKK